MGVSCWISPSASWPTGIFGGQALPRSEFLVVVSSTSCGSGFVCCTRLIRTLIIVCSSSCHLHLLEFNIPELRPPFIHCSLKYQGVERPNLLGLSCRLRFDCGMTFPTLCLTPERWMGSRVQSTVGCFPELCFLQFSVRQVLCGCKSNL